MHTTATDWPTLLKSIRSEFELTQERAAELLGVSARSWNAWEKGYRTPTPAARVLIRQLGNRVKQPSAS